MKHLTKLSLLALTGVLFASVSFTSAQDNNSDVVHGPNFVDENGDGYNDNAPDHDGDGIPNGQDTDYTSLNPDRGKGFGGFVDEDGDGINDRMQDADNDGVPNCLDEDYVRPQDGTGNKYGQKAGNGKGQKGQGFRGAGSQTGTGDGVCDGSGPRGKGRRGNAKK